MGDQPGNRVSTTVTGLHSREQAGDLLGAAVREQRRAGSPQLLIAPWVMPLTKLRWNVR